MTLEELANRSELTKGFLSQLERDLTSPSVATLENILEALGTNLKDFFSEDEDEQIVFSKDDFFENIQDDYKISYIIPNAQKNEMEPILIELKEDKKSMEIDPHDGEEFGYVIQGKVTLVNGEEEYEVKKKISDQPLFPGSEDVRMQKFRPLSQRQAASKNSVFPECLSWYL